MTSEQAVTSSTRSGAEQSERLRITELTPASITPRWEVFITIWLSIFAMSIAGLTLSLYVALNSIATSIRELKPEMVIHQHPTRVEVIQPKPLLPEVR